MALRFFWSFIILFLSSIPFVYAENCSEGVKQVLGQQNISSISSTSKLLVNLEKSFCIKDIIIKVNKRTELYDGSVELHFNVSNTGEADAVLEVFSSKGKIINSYFIPGKRPFSTKLSQILKVNISSTTESATNIKNNLTETRWVTINSKVPLKGSIRFVKNNDVALAASLMRIPLKMS